MYRYLLYVFLLIPITLSGQDTRKIMLSGSGLDNTVEWDFFCTGGQNPNKWNKIAVPSNWELQGYGEYTYGRWYKNPAIKEPSQEEGLYRYEFNIPSEYKGQTIDIVFDGVMTDAEVKINGKLAGDIHQGAFYRFKYNITDKVNWSKKNLLEVKVSKQSADKSVNAAERRADWWLFGGIYRPVYLEIKPEQYIRHVAIDAKANGVLKSVLTLSQNTSSVKHIKLSLSDVNGNQFQSVLFPYNDANQKQVEVQKLFDNINTWTCEAPNLYFVQLELLDKNQNVIHKHKERIGFRTVDFKPQDGIYVNGTKIILKGINRHSFHPDGGRCTNAKISLEDVKLMKEMNINAVRFHYPPDDHFLDICDSLGLFVIDELAGWQNPYSTETGQKLLREMIEKDVNHPSVILWSNGNEGGWNKNLDTLFTVHDPQKRHVLHPWADFGGLDTHHYPEYQTGIARFTNGYKVFMPTEFMHGMYDQGHGAGLKDFWTKYKNSPFFAGGFMWDFSDNAVRRTDKGGILDTDNDHAADGILGPYREKEGSFYTVREIWSPIQIQPLLITPSFDGTLYVTNDYLYTNLQGCYLQYEVLKINSPLTGKTGQTTIYEGKYQLQNVEPNETRKIKIVLPDNFFLGDILSIKAFDKKDVEVCTRTFPIKFAAGYWQTQLSSESTEKPAALQEGALSILKNKNTKVTFDTETGLLNGIWQQATFIPLTNGPIALGMQAEYQNYKLWSDADGAYFTTYYKGMLDSIQWKLDNNGILTMNALMLNRTARSGGFDDADGAQNISLFGFTFYYEENVVNSATWMGRGPYRVWKNRIEGTNMGLWQKDYNNTITGENGLIYPEFKGFHANMYWCRLHGASPFTVYSESDGVFLHLFTPEEPKGRANGVNTMPDFPIGNLSFLYEIPAIRDFKPISQHGPNSQPSSIRIKRGDEGIRMILHFIFNK